MTSLQLATMNISQKNALPVGDIEQQQFCILMEEF